MSPVIDTVYFLCHIYLTGVAAFQCALLIQAIYLLHLKRFLNFVLLGSQGPNLFEKQDKNLMIKWKC